MDEDLHHVLFGVCGHGRGAALAVDGDVERLVVVEHLEHVAVWGRVDNGTGDELVHCLVVRGVGGVVDETCATCVDGTGEEGKSDGALVGDSLKGTDEVGTFKVLEEGSVSWANLWGL